MRLFHMRMPNDYEVMLHAGSDEGHFEHWDIRISNHPFRMKHILQIPRAIRTIFLLKFLDVWCLRMAYWIRALLWRFYCWCFHTLNHSASNEKLQFECVSERDLKKLQYTISYVTSYSTFVVYSVFVLCWERNRIWCLHRGSLSEWNSQSIPE